MLLHGAYKRAFIAIDDYVFFVESIDKNNYDHINISKAFVYNLTSKRLIQHNSSKEFLKNLKKNDIIEKFKDDQVRIDKLWLTIGNHLGADMYELYDGLELYGFINTATGKVWDVAYYNYFGGYCDGNFELLEGVNRFWMDVEGVRRENNKNENGTYKGISRLLKVSDKEYVMKQNRNGQDYLIIGDNSLLNKEQYLKVN